MVTLIAGTAVAVSAVVITTTQVLGASNRGDPVAVPPQSSIQEAPPGEPSLTRSRPSVFCHRDERPVACVRWIHPLDHRQQPRVIPTLLGPLLHTPGNLTLLDDATGQVLWAQDQAPLEGHVAGIAVYDDAPTIILLHGTHLVFRSLHTGTVLGEHPVLKPSGSLEALHVAEMAVVTGAVQLGPDDRPESFVVSAWAPEGRTWEAQIALTRDDDHGPWGHVESVTDAEVVMWTSIGTVVLDARTGQELRRDVSPRGHHVIDGDVGLRTEWDEGDPETSTLLVDDLQTSQVLWTQELASGEEWWLLGPGIVGIFQRPQLIARDTRTGEVLWNLHLETRSEFIWAPYNPTDLLILVDESTQLIRGIATATGEERWRFTSPSTLPSALHWFYPDANHVALRHPQRAGFVLLDRDTGQVVIDLATDGRLLGEAWDVDVRWPVLQSSTGHLYLVSLDLPEATP